MPRDETTEEDQKAINEWLSKNKITICEPNARTDRDDIGYAGWGRKKKAGRPKAVDSKNK